MQEIVFYIDTTTGALTMRVKGVKGKACEPIAALVEEFLGSASRHTNTTEYHLTTVVPVVKAKGS